MKCYLYVYLSSLVNIYKELESDIEGFRNPKHGYLIGWARQGMLLFNSKPFSVVRVRV